MLEQETRGYIIKIISRDELGGYPMTGVNDAAIIEIYKGDEQVDSAWITISKNGIARLDRIV